MTNEANKDKDETGLEVDRYGNTEESFVNCSFPDCGCNGARLCMAGDASTAALALNIEKRTPRKY